MNTPYNNSQLDNFLRDTLKLFDMQYQQSDWSEMESILGPAHKSFEFNISKKTIFISASVIMIVVIGIVISQINFNNSSSEEISPAHTDSSQKILTAVDTQATTVASPVSLTSDSAKIESSALAVQENKIMDSVKINQKPDKKQKKNNVQSTTADSSVKITSISIPPVDTASKRAVQEIKVVIPSAPTDSSKFPAPSKKSKKNKKQKNSSADSSKTKSSSPAKQDSLK